MEKILNQLHKKLHNNLISVLTYRKQILIVVTTADTATLSSIAGLFKEVPLVLREKDIKDGLDVFAIDFLDIMTDYTVEYGKDMFLGVKLAKKHIRNQLEFMLRSKLIAIRERYLASPKKASTVILQHTMESMLPLLKALLAVKGLPIPGDIYAIIENVEHEYTISLAILRKIYKTENLDNEKAVNELITLLTHLCDSVETL